MVIQSIDHFFSICKVQDLSLVKLNAEFCFLGKTDEELSLVCLTKDVPANTLVRDDGWKSLRLQGVLDFSLLGILAQISGILAREGIAIFVVSTFNTDYILVKQERYEAALKALQVEGYSLA